MPERKVRSDAERVRIEAIFVGDYVFVDGVTHPTCAQCVINKLAKTNDRTARIVGWWVELADGHHAWWPRGGPVWRRLEPPGKDRTMSLHSDARTDADIQRDVLEELRWDTRVEPDDVGVEVHDGVVTLTGRVPSWAKKIAAEEAAHRVHGVRDVANDMIVKPATSVDPDDSEITAAVRAALTWDVFVPEDRIHATVMGGYVTLKGEVETHAQRDDAARAVRNLRGVRGLLNQLRVTRSGVTPEVLRSAIEDALERRADREAAKIQIDIEGGHVTLHGDVSSWTERQAVLAAVTGTRGVEDVRDRLRVGAGE